RVDVINVDRLVFALVREAEGRDPKVAQDDYCKKIADEVVTERAMDSEYSGSFLVNEWEQVVLANNCRSRADYFGRLWFYACHSGRRFADKLDGECVGFQSASRFKSFACRQANAVDRRYMA
ncbi:MAG TPA: hypothetical protein PKI87_07750, partial [Arenimonas sp.]|nr:hypothetical protein [Arenimonas sp.]